MHGCTKPLNELREGSAAALVAAVEAALGDLADGAAALVAMSGGPDSAALAALTRQARPDLHLTAVHVRHGLRDDTPDANAARAQARLLGLSLFEEPAGRRPRAAPAEEAGGGGARGDPGAQLPRLVASRSDGTGGGQTQVAHAVPADGGSRGGAAALDPVPHAAWGGGPESRARGMRYAALRRVAEGVGAVAVLVGHTADDRAETVLLRIARGTGIGGLGGMAADARVHGVRVLRPLLGLRRSAVRAHVRAAGLPVATDPTNADHEQPRARARALLPQLDRLAGGPRDAVTTLLRLADLATEDAAALDGLAEEAVAGLRRWGPAACVPDSAVAAPRALASRVVRALVAAAGGAPATAAAVRAVLELTPGRVVALPGDLRVGRGSGWLVAVPPHPALAPRPLPAGAAVVLPELGLVIANGAAVSTPDGAAVPPGARGGERGWLGGAGPYLVRGLERGDRLPGGRRVADALARSGVPRLLRELVPLVCDAGGAPLWAPGLRVAEHAGPGVPVAVCGATARTPETVH